jgi:hypothetical protein
MKGRPKHLDAASREVDDEHRVERQKATPRPNLGGEKIGSGDRSPVRAKKLLPRRRALRRWEQTVGLQNPGDRRSPDLAPNVLEGTLNARVTPRRIVLGHAHFELPNLGQNTPTADSLPRIRPFARHQLPVPSQQRVRRDDRREVTQGSPPEPVRAHCEPPPVIVSKPQAPSTELPPEEAILFDQIGERLPFPAIQRTGDTQEQEPKRGHVDHRRELISDTHRKCP